MLLQFQQYVELIEMHPFSQQNLIPLMMSSFDKRYLLPVTKNFLRFSKGQGFKEFTVPFLVEDTRSEYYQRRFSEQLRKVGESKEFMNHFFNNLNELTTELFVQFKDLKNVQSFHYDNAMRRTKQTFTLVIDLNRLLELMIRVAPQVFLQKDQIHCSRAFNYVMFVLNSIFNGSVATFIDSWHKNPKNRKPILL